MKLKEYLQNIRRQIIENRQMRDENPKVRFKSLKLEAAIGHWLGIIPLDKTSRIYKISNRELTSVELEFEKLLKELGVNEMETCELSPINISDNSDIIFNCSFVSSGASKKIILRYGDCIDFSPEMIITTPLCSFSYEYFNNLNPKLYLREKGIQNTETKSTYYRELCSYSAKFKLVKKNGFSLEIEVDRPNGTEVKIPNGFVLDNESELEKYLLNLPTDANPVDIFNNFCEICYKGASEQEINKQNITLEYKPHLLSDLNYAGVCKIILNNGTLQIYTKDKGSGKMFMSESTVNHFKRKKLEMQRPIEG